jgi:hypothetical protein
LLSLFAIRYSEISDDVSVEQIMVRFFGYFFLLFHTSGVIGNGISAAVLGSGENSTGVSDIGTKSLQTALKTCIEA